MNDLKENRKKIQNLAISSEFVKAMTSYDLPLEIIEQENKNKNQMLQKLIIENVPKNDQKACSWIINLEIEKSIFSAPSHFKKSEKALVFFQEKDLYVVLIEMKNKIALRDKNIGLDDILRKIEESISRLQVFLPIYLFDIDQRFENTKIKYKALICYNHQRIDSQAQNENDIDLKLYPIFQNKKGNLNIGNLDENKVFFHFLQNTPNNLTTMSINLSEIFRNDTNENFMTWETNLSCI